MHVIAGKAVCFADAMKPEFKVYAQAVVDNAKALASSLQEQGLDIVSGGTDNHLMLVDLRPKQAKGKHAEIALDRASITCNKNNIPFDTEKALLTSGIRLGTPAGTTRGFGTAEFRTNRPDDRRCGRRLAQKRCRRRRTDRSADQGRSRSALRTLSHLSGLIYNDPLKL